MTALVVYDKARLAYRVYVNGKRLRRWKECSRLVYRSVRLGVVVKIGDQSEYEFERWNSFTPDERSHVARMLASGVSSIGEPWVLQEYVPGKPVKSQTNDEYNLYLLMKRLGLNDWHEQQAVVREDGKIVIVDYAF